MVQFPVDAEWLDCYWRLLYRCSIIQVYSTVQYLTTLSVFSYDLAQLCRASREESSGADTDNWVRGVIALETAVSLDNWNPPWMGYLSITG